MNRDENKIATTYQLINQVLEIAEKKNLDLTNEFVEKWRGRQVHM